MRVNMKNVDGCGTLAPMPHDLETRAGRLRHAREAAGLTSAAAGAQLTGEFEEWWTANCR